MVNSILDYRNEGPYYLGGWSASGVVAYEIARQLKEKGREVALLVMFDTANPAFQQRVLKEFRLDSWVRKMKFFATELWGLKARKCAGLCDRKGEGAPSKTSRSRLANPV